MTQATDPERDGTGGLHRPPPVADLAATPSTGALLTALFDLVHDAKRRGATTAGTTQLLVALSRSGPLCGADLATVLRLDQSTVSRHLAALEADGLVRRTADERDRRVHNVELTDAGQAQVTAVLRQRVASLESAVADWSPADVDSLAQLLSRFNASLRSTMDGTDT